MADRLALSRLIACVNWSAVALIALLAAAWSAITCAAARAWD